MKNRSSKDPIFSFVELLHNIDHFKWMFDALKELNCHLDVVNLWHAGVVL